MPLFSSSSDDKTPQLNRAVHFGHSTVCSDVTAAVRTRMTQNNAKVGDRVFADAEYGTIDRVSPSGRFIAISWDDGAMTCDDLDEPEIVQLIAQRF